MNGSRYINLVSECLKDKLPQIVTKEELMNCYLHELKARGAMDTKVTVVNLVQAANLMGVKVKGQSKLEVNVPIMEQWRYISQDIKARTTKNTFKEKLNNNKESIVKAYESGESIKSLAYAWNCNISTKRRYLISFGVEIRKSGTKELNVVANRNSYGKKKKRRNRCA
jgi:hypothetical protein